MDRVALFIDAGYIYAQGSVCLAGKKRDRRDLILNIPAVIKFFTALAPSSAPNTTLLRIYWYDGAYRGPSPDQLTLAHTDNVKVRLGIVNSAGQQKGVDSLIITDLIDLSRNNAITDAILVTGDEDLRVGVQVAQEFGIRVHLVGITPARANQSRTLMQESDTTQEIDKSTIQGFLSLHTAPATLTMPTPIARTPAAPLPPFAAPATAAITTTTATPIDAQLTLVAESILNALSSTELIALPRVITDPQSVPYIYDRKILGKSRVALGRDLTGEERNRARRLFFQTMKLKTSPPS